MYTTLSIPDFKNKARVQPEEEVTGGTGRRVGGIQPELQWRSHAAADSSAKMYPALERGVQECSPMFWDKCDETRVRISNLSEDTSL